MVTTSGYCSAKCSAACEAYSPLAVTRINSSPPPTLPPPPRPCQSRLSSTGTPACALLLELGPLQAYATTKFDEPGSGAPAFERKDALRYDVGPFINLL